MNQMTRAPVSIRAFPRRAQGPREQGKDWTRHVFRAMAKVAAGRKSQGFRFVLVIVDFVAPCGPVVVAVRVVPVSVRLASTDLEAV
jgi:hypothetical protein